MKWVHHTIIFSAMLAILAWVANTPPSTQKAVYFPWKIQVENDRSQVFGLTLPGSRLEQALTVLGEDITVAIFQHPGKPLRLEGYYPKFQSGQLHAKLVLTLDLTQARLQTLYMAYSAHKVPIRNAGFKTEIDFRRLPDVMSAAIIGVTYSPTAKLDAAILTARFGAPTRKMQAPQVTHWLYPAKGLSISFDARGETLFQYVAPGEFDRIEMLFSAPQNMTVQQATQG